MTEDTSPENLRKFLESDDPAMVRMGLSMAKGSGVPEELLPTILELYMWDDAKTIRAAAKSVFNKHAPAELQAKVKENWKPSYRTLSISGDKFPEAIRPFLEAFKSQDVFSDIALKPVIKALHRSQSTCRREDDGWKAALALEKIGEPAIEPLIKALRHRRVAVRRNAANALGGEAWYYRGGAPGAIGDARAVDPLIKALGDRNSDVRSSAAGALGMIGKSAMEPLIKALGDEKGYVRQHAAKALGKIGDTHAVEPLIKVLEGAKGRVCSSATEALGEIGDERAVEPLIKALRDGSRDVRYYATEALGKIGNKQAVETLIKALEDEDEYIGGTAKIALYKLGRRAEIQNDEKRLEASKEVQQRRKGRQSVFSEWVE